jgi:hypothetical protein
MVFSRPLASTQQSRVACASKWFSASWKPILSSFDRIAATVRPNLGFALIPVPTAVPPIGRFVASTSRASSARATA